VEIERFNNEYYGDLSFILGKVKFLYFIYFEENVFKYKIYTVKETLMFKC